MTNKAVKRNIRLIVYLLGLITGTIFFYSCKVSHEATNLKLRPLSTSKILKYLNEKPSGYDNLSVKRINCQVSGLNGNTSFKAAIKLVKDEKILISFSKINLPVGRILLTPDSVKYVNYIDKQYFRGGYDFISDLLKLNIDFLDVQAILFNNFFSYYNNPENSDLSEFSSTIDSGRYVLRSINNRKLSKFYNKAWSEKADRYLKRKKEEILLVQTLYIEPEKYNILKLGFEDINNKRSVQFSYGDFSEVDGKDYPGSIDMFFNNKEEKINISVRMTGFSTEKEDDFDLKIPEKYVPAVLKN